MTDSSACKNYLLHKIQTDRYANMEDYVHSLYAGLSTLRKILCSSPDKCFSLSVSTISASGFCYVPGQTPRQSSKIPDFITFPLQFPNSVSIIDNLSFSSPLSFFFFAARNNFSSNLLFVSSYAELLEPITVGLPNPGVLDMFLTCKKTLFVMTVV